MPKQALVSVIVPTRNSADFLEACLTSLKAQTYQAIEIIIVDRDSTDATKQIARRFTPHVYNYGPERSAQRNFGVNQAKGEYVAIIDSDMELSAQVIAACIREITKDVRIKGIIIPEESFGEGFWAQCKALERSFYVGHDAIEAVRFFERTSYQKLGGYDSTLVAGEDWDLSNRLRAIAPISRIQEFIHHNEGRLSFTKTLRKKYYYAQHSRKYLSKSYASPGFIVAIGPFQRYKLFFSRPHTLFRQPLIGLGLLLLKTAEYASGAIAYLLAAPTSRKIANE